MKNSVVKFLLVIFFIPLLAGCSAQMKIKDVRAPTPHQRIVFGKFNLLVNGQPQSWKSFLSPMIGTRAWFLILPPGSTKAIRYEVDGDGFFYWGLEPGDYLILGFVLTRGGANKESMRIGATFTVSKERKNVYIGNMQLLLLNDHAYGFGIKDDYLADLNTFRIRFPKVQEPVKSLAMPEQKPGNYNRVNNVCAKEWGVDCSKKHFMGVGFFRYDGVTPLNPKVISINCKMVSVTDSFSPKFAWNPSSVNDVSYDLVVHEATSYSLFGFDTSYMPGRLVEYKEGIKETSYRLQDALQPNSKYFWSIRLRRNDVVSTWSTFSYFQTIIIASGSGQDQWFSFATPSGKPIARN